MNKDIRLLTTFPRHPKTIKLKRILGTWEPIIVLWLWAAENRPSGDLTDMTDEDIAIAANWNDDPKTLIDALLQVRFIEMTNGQAYVLHGWKEHNAYAANSEKRSEKARLAAQARWDKKLNGCSNDANECSEHACSNAPTPNPTPNPNKYSADFLSFYSEYPNKKEKQNTYQRWLKLKKAQKLPSLDVLLLSIQKQKEWRKNANGEFRPEWKNPATWLNKGCWDDETECKPKTKILTGDEALYHEGS